jgi:hypothetical protein
MRIRFAIFALGFFAAGVCAAPPATSPSETLAYDQDPYYQPAADDSTQAVLLKAARRVLFGITRKEAIVAYTPEFIELRIKASLRLRDCEFLLAKNKDERIHIAERHKSDMIALMKRQWSIRSIDVDITGYVMSRTMLAEAQLVLDREKAGGAAAPEPAAVPSAEAWAKTSSELYEALNKKLKDVAATPEYVELVTTASQDLRSAELMLAKNKQARIAAAQKNIDRMKALAKAIWDRREIDIDLVQIWQTEYAVAEAQLILEREKSAEEK